MQPVRPSIPTRGRLARRRYRRKASPSLGPPPGAAVGLQVDQHTRDTGPFKRFQRLARELRWKLDERELGMDRDMAEIAAVQPAFVGDCANDRARADLVPLSDVDPIGRHPLTGAANRLG